MKLITVVLAVALTAACARNDGPGKDDLPAKPKAQAQPQEAEAKATIVFGEMEYNIRAQLPTQEDRTQYEEILIVAKEGNGRAKVYSNDNRDLNPSYKAECFEMCKTIHIVRVDDYIELGYTPGVGFGLVMTGDNKTYKLFTPNGVEMDHATLENFAKAIEDYE